MKSIDAVASQCDAQSAPDMNGFVGYTREECMAYLDQAHRQLRDQLLSSAGALLSRKEFLDEIKGIVQANELPILPAWWSDEDDETFIADAQLHSNAIRDSFHQVTGPFNLFVVL